MITLDAALDAVAQVAAPDVHASGGGGSTFESLLFVVSVSVVSVLLVAAVVPVILLSRAAKKNERGLRAARKAIRQMPPATRRETLDAIATHLAFDSVLKAQWEEFREGVVEVEGEGETRLYNTLPFGAFVKDESYIYTIQAGRLRFPVLHRIPNLCTGIGILGTFTGITIALMSLTDALQITGGLGENAETQNQLVTSLPALVSSLSSAFVTSIEGVVVSLVVTFWVNHRESHVLAELDRLREAVDGYIPRITTEGLLERFRRETQASQSTLPALADALAEKLGSRVDGSLRDVMLPQLQAMTQAVRDQVQSAGASSQAQARRFTDEMVQQLAQSMHTSFSQMGDSLTGNAQRLDDVSKTLVRVVTEAGETVQQQRSLMAESTAAVRSAQDGARATATQLDNTQDVAAKLAKLSEKIESHLERSAQLQETEARLRSEAEEHQRRAAETMAATSSHQDEVAEKALRAAESVAQLVNELKTATESLTATAASTAGQVERASSSLIERAEQEATLVKDLQVAASTMSETMAASKPALLAFEQASQQLVSQHQRIDQASGHFADLVQRIGETGGQVVAQLKEVQESLQRSAFGITNVLSGVQRWSSQTDTTLEDAGNGVRKPAGAPAQEVDKSLLSAVTHLHTSLEDFSGIVKELSDTTRRLKR